MTRKELMQNLEEDLKDAYVALKECVEEKQIEYVKAISLALLAIKD